MIEKKTVEAYVESIVGLWSVGVRRRHLRPQLPGEAVKDNVEIGHGGSLKH